MGNTIVSECCGTGSSGNRNNENETRTGRLEHTNRIRGNHAGRSAIHVKNSITEERQCTLKLPEPLMVCERAAAYQGEGKSSSDIRPPTKTAKGLTSPEIKSKIYNGDNICRSGLRTMSLPTASAADLDTIQWPLLNVSSQENPKIHTNGLVIDSVSNMHPCSGHEPRLTNGRKRNSSNHTKRRSARGERNKGGVRKAEATSPTVCTPPQQLPFFEASQSMCKLPSDSTKKSRPSYCSSDRGYSVTCEPRIHTCSRGQGGVVLILKASSSSANIYGPLLDWSPVRDNGEPAHTRTLNQMTEMCDRVLTLSTYTVSAGRGDASRHVSGVATKESYQNEPPKVEAERTALFVALDEISSVHIIGVLSSETIAENEVDRPSAIREEHRKIDVWREQEASDEQPAHTFDSPAGKPDQSSTRRHSRVHALKTSNIDTHYRHSLTPLSQTASLPTPKRERANSPFPKFQSSVDSDAFLHRSGVQGDCVAHHPNANTTDVSKKMKDATLSGAPKWNGGSGNSRANEHQQPLPVRTADYIGREGSTKFPSFRSLSTSASVSVESTDSTGGHSPLSSTINNYTVLSAHSDTLSLRLAPPPPPLLAPLSPRGSAVLVTGIGGHPFIQYYQSVGERTMPLAFGIMTATILQPHSQAIANGAPNTLAPVCVAVGEVGRPLLDEGHAGCAKPAHLDAFVRVPSLKASAGRSDALSTSYANPKPPTCTASNFMTPTKGRTLAGSKTKQDESTLLFPSVPDVGVLDLPLGILDVKELLSPGIVTETRRMLPTTKSAANKQTTGGHFTPHTSLIGTPTRIVSPSRAEERAPLSTYADGWAAVHNFGVLSTTRAGEEEDSDGKSTTASVYSLSNLPFAVSPNSMRILGTPIQK